jgi:hypothetical protein
MLFDTEFSNEKDPVVADLVPFWHARAFACFCQQFDERL